MKYRDNTARIVGLTLILFVAAAGLVPDAGAQGRSAGKDTDIMAVLSVEGYGYKVKVLLNGIDVGIQGGKSENKRLFNKGNSMAKEAAPAMRPKIFLLNEGDNQIVVEYAKTDEKGGDTLQVSVEIEGYPMPSFFMRSTARSSARIEKFPIQKVPAQDFKPVLVSDAGGDKIALVSVSTMNYQVTPSLNGKPGMSLGMIGTSALEGIRDGSNELTIRYSSSAGAREDLRFSIATPEWTRTFTRKPTDGADKTETFTFRSR